jgi:ABC-type nitrate/sulfonate/bicarbonate transport system permease component
MSSDPPARTVLATTEGPPLRQAQRPGRGFAGQLPAWVLPVAATILIVGVLELVVRGGLVLRTAFPAPSEVAEALYQLVQQSTYWLAVWNTLQGWALGLGLAILAGVPLGILVGTSGWLFRSVRFPVDFLRPIPTIALLPLFILLFGFTLELKVYIAALGAFWPLFFQTLYGVQDVDSVARDTARAYRLGRFLRFVFVDVPGATPYIATGLRISASVALVVCVATELIVGVPGLGANIFKAQYAGRVDTMYALIVTSGVIGLTIAILFNRLERWTLRWHPSQRGERVL